MIIIYSLFYMSFDCEREISRRSKLGLWLANRFDGNLSRDNLLYHGLDRSPVFEQSVFNLVVVAVGL